MKRFYNLVSTHKTDMGVEIHLDGKPVKTPAGYALLAPNHEIAQSMAAEWNAQIDEVDPQTMPFTQVITTALDKGGEDRGEMEGKLLQYINTDLLCYRTDTPKDIALKQSDVWDTFLAKIKNEYGFEIFTTTGFDALSQPDGLHKKIKSEIEAMGKWQFTVLQMAASITGSILLALLFLKGEVSEGEMFEASFVEEMHKGEIYNEEKYGPDPITEKKMKLAKTDLKVLHALLSVV